MVYEKVRRRREFKRRRRSEEKRIVILPKHILFLLSFLCMCIMFVSYRFPQYVSPLKNVVDFIVNPMQTGINSVGHRVMERRNEKKNIAELQKENAALKKQLEIMSDKATITSQDKYELDALRKLYELDSKYNELPKVAARIIARESNGWYNSFTIDKGYSDGIKKDMNVIAGNGLVGLVTDVRRNTSTVRSIIEDGSNVSGMFSGGDTCMVSGDMNMLKKSGSIEISMISLNAVVIENEEVVTSHISDKYLSGILMGYVKNVQVDSSIMTRKAELVPAVDFEKLDEVLIITVLKNNDED